MTRSASKRKQLVANLTVDDLKKMIKQIARQVVRDEKRRDYYINADGIKVLYEEADIDPDYLAELNEHARAEKEGREKLISSEEFEKEMRKLGVRI